MPRPERERDRRGGSKNKYIVLILISCFVLLICHNKLMTMFLKYFRHKVDLVGCSTFKI